jgi:DNA-binding Lrp family transcriptional regulator
MLNELDSLDFKIIKELQEDVRISITQLALKTGSSRPTVTKKLKKLIDDGFVGTKAGLNASRMGFKVALIGLEIMTDDSRSSLFKRLQDCPRVLSIARTTEKANIIAMVWGEDDNTLQSTVESFRDLVNVSLVYSHSLGTPVSQIIVPLILGSEDNTPCGLSCDICDRYKSNWCLGCPSTKHYKFNYLQT